MRLKVIIPNAGMQPETLRSRERMLKEVAMPDTQVSVDCIDRGPESIESNYDKVLAGSYIMEKVMAAQEQGFDAVIIYCGSDPAIEAARECVNIPVIGPGKIAMLLANDLAYNFSIISTLELSVPRDVEYVRMAGLDVTRLKSVRCLNMPVSNVRDDLEASYQALLAAGRKAVEEDGAHALVLKCLGMAGLGRRLQSDLGVPVIDTAFVTIKYAELLVTLGLSHSRKSYPTPPEKVRL